MAVRVSIIITTRNRAHYLRETLDSFKRLRTNTELAVELLVVDNASTDNTAEVIKSCKIANLPVRYAYEPNPGQSKARNSGMNHTTSDAILFTDDDVRVPANWIPEMVEPILSGKAAAVAGGVKIAPHLERPWMTARHRSGLAATLRLDPLKPQRMVGANMAFSRRVLERVPAFDEELGPGGLGFGDDSLFSGQLQEAGFVLVGRMEVKVEHHFDQSRLTYAAWLDRARNGGRSSAYVDYHWRHRDQAFQGVSVLRDSARLVRERWRDRKQNADEGCSEEEYLLVRRLAYRQQFRIESNRPRKYALHGLVKLAYA